MKQIFRTLVAFVGVGIIYVGTSKLDEWEEASPVPARDVWIMKVQLSKMRALFCVIKSENIFLGNRQPTVRFLG